MSRPRGRELVEAKLTDTFGLEDVDHARAALEGYGDEHWHREPDRVRLALLKLSGGRLDALRRWAETARADYRDVLAAAESPNAFQIPPQESGSPAAREARAQDAQQYQKWLASSRSHGRNGLEDE